MPEHDVSSAPPRPPALGEPATSFGETVLVDDAAIAQSRINFSWLLKVRWAAACGQLSTVLFVSHYLHVELPLGWLLSIIALGAMTNAALLVWFRRQHRLDRWRHDARRGARIIGSIMVLDILLLTALLYASGGPSNPFSIFYFVNLTLAAVMLRGRWALALGSFTVACYAFLFLLHRPLPALGDLSDLSLKEILTGDVVASPVLLNLAGILVAFGTAALIVTYFIIRVSSELAQRELELSRARHARAQSEKLEALATLAAGAAHELASPLSTIAVVAKDLELQLNSGSTKTIAVEDAKLIRDEVNRCRKILDQMSTEAGQNVGETLDRVPVRALIASTLEGVAARDRIYVDGLDQAGDRHVYVPRNAFAQALRAIVQNGLDASEADTRVVLQCRPKPQQLVIRIWDQGRGMAPDVLARADQPFFTTKEAGGGMGLGLFLARTTVERLGGELGMSSVPGTGTMVVVSIPWEQGIDSGEEQLP